jgi:uncharacterized protein DUF6644
MHETIMAFARWLESTPWGVMTRESNLAYPYVQLVHFTGLSIWLGTTFMLDLRLLGVGFRRATAAKMAQDLFVWNWIGFAIALTGGFLLFSGLARLFVDNGAFQWKLGMLVPLSLMVHISVQRNARFWGKTSETPPIAKFAALLEILLWIGVVTAAVQIPSY